VLAQNRSNTLCEASARGGNQLATIVGDVKNWKEEHAADIATGELAKRTSTARCGKAFAECASGSLPRGYLLWSKDRRSSPTNTIGETRDREVKNVSRKARNCPGFLKSPVAPAS
jgi:hypothetical protein